MQENKLLIHTLQVATEQVGTDVVALEEYNGRMFKSLEDRYETLMDAHVKFADENAELRQKIQRLEDAQSETTRTIIKILAKIL